MALADIKVYGHMPDGFSPQVEVAATYVSINDKILLLKLVDHKEEQGLWGVPAGKFEIGEKPFQAAKRELFEETGIYAQPHALKPLGKLYIRRPHLDYTYHLFGLRLESTPPLSLSPEHCSYLWVSKEEAQTL